MEKKKARELSAAAAVLVLAVVLVLWYAWYYCHIGKRKACSATKGSFCGAPPRPDAAAEAAALHHMGLRLGPSGRDGAPPGEGGGPHSYGRQAAHSEAAALQAARGLHPGAPPYSPHETAPDDRGVASLLEKGPDGRFELDEAGARQLVRDGGAFASARGRRENLRSNPAHTSARQARLDSMRAGFDGEVPPPAGTPPASCTRDCVDGCVGTSCEDLCRDQCGTAY